MWWSVAKCCSVVMFCWFFFYHCVYGCVFCILLFNSASYVFLLLGMFCSVYSVSIMPTGTLWLPWLRFSVLFPQLQGKCQGVTRKDGAWPALFLISELCCSTYCLCRLCCSMHCLCRLCCSMYFLCWLCCSMHCLCRLCCSVYCLCVNVYCTDATGWLPNCS